MAKVYLRDFPPKLITKAEVAQPDWICVPVSLCRDSESLERANFDEVDDIFDSLDPYAKKWECLYFDHFEVGWTGQIFVHPDFESKIKELREKLAKYPCLNEDLWVEYEVQDKESK